VRYAAPALAIVASLVALYFGVEYAGWALFGSFFWALNV